MSNGRATLLVPGKALRLGLGPPRARQGWLVLAAFVALLALGAIVILPTRQPVCFVAYAAVLCATLVAVCYLKGEPPWWRWGKK